MEIFRNYETKKWLIRKMTLGYETNELTSVDIDTELDFIFCETIFNSSLQKFYLFAMILYQNYL